MEIRAAAEALLDMLDSALRYSAALDLFHLVLGGIVLLVVLHLWYKTQEEVLGRWIVTLLFLATAGLVTFTLVEQRDSLGPAYHHQNDQFIAAGYNKDPLPAASEEGPSVR